MSNVSTLAQFLMVDDKPRAGATDVERYGATFQSGLMTEDGKRKPAYNAYRLPIHIAKPRVREGRMLAVWGLVRPGRPTTRETVAIQLRRGKKGKFRTARRVRTEPRRGYFSARLRLRRSGAVRFSWTDPRSKRTFRSRVVGVTAR